MLERRGQDPRATPSGYEGSISPYRNLPPPTVTARTMAYVSCGDGLVELDEGRLTVGSGGPLPTVEASEALFDLEVGSLETNTLAKVTKDVRKERNQKEIHKACICQNDPQERGPSNKCYKYNFQPMTMMTLTQGKKRRNFLT